MGVQRRLDFRGVFKEGVDSEGVFIEGVDSDGCSKKV